MLKFHSVQALLKMLKVRQLFAQLVNDSCIVLPCALHPDHHTQNCLLYRTFTPMLNLRGLDASSSVFQESSPQADCSNFSMSTLELSQCTSRNAKVTRPEGQRRGWPAIPLEGARVGSQIQFPRTSIALGHLQIKRNRSSPEVRYHLCCLFHSYSNS